MNSQGGSTHGARVREDCQNLAEKSKEMRRRMNCLPDDCRNHVESWVHELYRKEHREEFCKVLSCIASYGPSTHEDLPDLINLHPRARPTREEELFCRVSEALLNHFIYGRIGNICGCTAAPPRWQIYRARAAIKN